MKNSKKHLMEIVIMMVSIIVFFLIFRNWDNIKEFIVNLF
jgi:uncharacterized membrane protein